MKIIHYTPSLDRSWGGTAVYMQLLAKELGQLIELHVVSHASNNPLIMQNCQVHNLSSMSYPLELKRQWAYLLYDIKPDLVHINCCWSPSCAILQWWAQNLGFKVVLTPHGMLEPWIIARHYWTRKIPALLLYQKAAVKRAEYLHATAEGEKENLLKLGYNKKVQIIANGIDVESIVMKQSWKCSREILFLSRVHVKKGIRFLIEAVAQLKKQMQGYVVRIVGEGDEAYINELKQLATNRDVMDIIHFEGGVYGERKWALYRTADCFILPTHSENFALVVAEALASGTPVITTKGTPWSDLESRHCGWWTEIGVKPTKEALLKFLMLTDKELEVMGRNGRKLVEEKYSARKMAEDMVVLYQKVIR